MHRRVQKRRRRDTDKDVRDAPRRLSNDSDSEERPSSSEGPSQKKQPAVPAMGFMATIRGILTFIDAHPSLPTTLSIYLQFVLNCFLTGLLILMIYKGFSVISNDINERAIMESSEIIAEMASCAHEYHENRCERDSRVPAMEMVCNNWEKCMARDPFKVGRSRLSAGMFAEIFNSFIEPISFKAIVRLPPYLHSLSPCLRRNPQISNALATDRRHLGNRPLLRDQQHVLRAMAIATSPSTAASFVRVSRAAAAADGVSSW